MRNGIKLMGIVNVNEDSFIEASRAAGADEAKRRIDGLLERGCDIIDIGAVSSRPGASSVSAEEEWRRLEPVLEMVSRDFKGYSFSIDTFRASIVVAAYQTIGKFTVNDISAGDWDAAMLPTAGRLGLRFIAMHRRGTFGTMHDEYRYDDVVSSVEEYFNDFKERAREAGIDNWILDPGFGFSKSAEDNLKLLDGLGRFKIFRRPILVGISRKRFTAGASEELERKAVDNGATIIRTH